MRPFLSPFKDQIGCYVNAYKCFNRSLTVRVDMNSGFLTSPHHIPLNTIIYTHYFNLKNGGILPQRNRKLQPQFQPTYPITNAFLSFGVPPSWLTYDRLLNSIFNFQLKGHFNFKGFRKRVYGIYFIGDHLQNWVAFFTVILPCLWSEVLQKPLTYNWPF